METPATNGVATLQYKSGPLVEISAALEMVLIQGDLSKLDADQRVEYYRAVCKSVGLNPLTRPFEYITLNGKLILYFNKSGAQQLSMIHSISFEQPKIERVGELYCVSVVCKNESGRTDSDMAAVDTKGLSGVNLANAMMKCMTKAKRRVTLSICGLSMLDESEIEDMERSQVREQIAKVEQAEPTKIIDVTPAPRTVEVDGSIVDVRTGEVVGNTADPIKEGPFSYALPYELTGIDMAKIREQLKKTFGAEAYNPENKTWNVPRRLKNNALISFDQYLVAVTPTQEVFGNDDINI